MQEDQQIENVSLTDSDSFSDSHGDMFGNLAPLNAKPTFDATSNQRSKLMMAKMKRLIGSSFNTKPFPFASLNSFNPQSQKPKKNNKQKMQKAFSSEESKFQSDGQSAQYQNRERSREKNTPVRTAQSVKSGQGIKRAKGQNAANFLIQKQLAKQNESLSSNKVSDRKQSFEPEQKPVSTKVSQKLEKFAEMEKLLFVPVEELPILRKTSEEVKEEKRQKKRVDRMLEKKYKEFKVGKVKDQASNCVFNGIEDYFN